MVDLSQKLGLQRPLTQTVTLGLVFLCFSALATMASPVPVDSAMFDKWTTDIEKARKGIGIQGTSVAVVHKGKIIYAKGFGKRNDVDPFTPETLAPIGSVTKSFTAAAIAELVSKKKASWDVPVSQYLPEFQLKDPRLTNELTFIDLLAHRTGMLPFDLDWVYRKEPRLELIKLMKHADAAVPVRSQFIYNNAMYTVAGEAGARIANTTYEQLVLESVIRPLGMKETGFSFEEMAKKSNYALPYACQNFTAALNGQTQRIFPDTTPYAVAPAGDIHSSAIELANLAKAIMHYGVVDGKQVLSKESIQQMRSAYMLINRTPSEPDFSTMIAGLGLAMDNYKGHRAVHHSGYIFGYNTNLLTFPDDDLAIINLSNTDVNSLPGTLVYYIADDVLNLPKTVDWLFDRAVSTAKLNYMIKGADDPAFLEVAFPPQIKDKPPTRALSDFAGEYIHPVGGKISFQFVKGKKKGEKNALAFNYRGQKGLLDHYHFDTFRLRVLGLGKFTYSHLISFVTGANGMVTGCNVFVGYQTDEYSKI